MSIDTTIGQELEWLETDGLGGFASGTASTVRTRRYHGLLLVATKPPAERFVLVNGIEARVEIDGRSYALSSQRYGDDVVHPDGATRIAKFKNEPWPTWRFAFDGHEIEHGIFAKSGTPLISLYWSYSGPSKDVRLLVRPLLSGRDPHALHHENPSFDVNADVESTSGTTFIRWHPYAGLPAIHVVTNGSYDHRFDWYRNFTYSEERARGLDFNEDLASPGELSWDLVANEAVLAWTTESQHIEPARRESALRWANQIKSLERIRRRAFTSPLARAADAYIVRRGEHKTIIAGYPWFGDWGRDTFIALRGLCLATGRLNDARRILLEWADTVSEGMVPNRFPDRGDTPEYNSVDASLWYIIAAEAYMREAASQGRLTPPNRDRLRAAIDAIIAGYMNGTRYGIGMDDDGLIDAGEPGVQLTWMDAKVGDWVVTPRIGKPVEIQALWINALMIASRWSPRYAPIVEHARRCFVDTFYDEARGYLYDVADSGHERGQHDSSFRPNQLFAIGGLPHTLVSSEVARSIVDLCETHLWTPIGPRSLSPEHHDYVPHYQGGVLERDGGYHQGTVWPWLSGAFVEAWVKARGNTPNAKQLARRRFLQPLFDHVDRAGAGHVSEIADAEPPHSPRGCPFQAWSVAELMRLDTMVLSEDRSSASSDKESE